MSDHAAIRLHGVGKMYKIFPSRLDTFIDTMGLARLMPWRPMSHREFWALREIDLTVGRGKRIGIIGCNGAGKSTLLKLITGNVAATEGEVHVDGQVHALMNTGAGFHPEFTGRENIVASLVHQGLDRGRIKAAIHEIAEFTELEEFLDQPFRTYSAGMQARLTFATATTIEPEILIIDEILGAGDGYFISKSTERVSRLVEDTGASVLIVSHGLDMIVRFCEEAIWIDRGRIVQRGVSLEVVKAYEQFLRVRNERRLKAKNRAVTSGGVETGVEAPLQIIVARFVVKGAVGSACDIAEVALHEDGTVVDRVLVGDAQDTDESRPVYVSLDENSDWSSPSEEEGRPHRAIELLGGGPIGGSVILVTYDVDDAGYALETTYRTRSADQVELMVWRNGRLVLERALPSDRAGWVSERVSLPVTDPAASEGTSTKSTNGLSVSRWPGEGSLTIEGVTTLDDEGRELAMFQVGRPMSVRVTFEAQREGAMPIVPTLAIYRADGIPVSRHRGESIELDLHLGEQRQLQLDLGPLNLGDGRYVFSVGLFRRFDVSRIDEAQPYQIIDRSYEFEVFGNPPNMAAVFQHPGQWRLLQTGDVHDRSRHPDMSKP